MVPIEYSIISLRARVNLVPLFRPTHLYYIMSTVQEQSEEYNPIEHFIYGLKAPESRRQYPRRLKVFLDFLNLEGSANEQAKSFWSKAKKRSKMGRGKINAVYYVPKEEVNY